MRMTFCSLYSSLTLSKYQRNAVLNSEIILPDHIVFSYCTSIVYVIQNILLIKLFTILCYIELMLYANCMCTTMDEGRQWQSLSIHVSFPKAFGSREAPVNICPDYVIVI